MFLLTLRFYATGSMLIVVGDFIGVDKSTASRVVDKVSQEIAKLGKTYIRFPTTQEEIRKINLGFYNIAKFPLCVGAIDCTHVKIQSPGGNEAEIYRNRKGYFSVNVQATCDAALSITNIVCRWPGSSHDSSIFNNSRLRRFENKEFGANVLVGDSGYAVKSYMITPLANPSTAAENLFNEAQIRTRNPIERCFGVVKRRFPILSLGIRLKLEKVEAIVVATAVLHNIACTNREPLPPLDEEIENLIEQDMATAVVATERAENIPANNTNHITRLNLINNYFGTLL